MRNNPTYSDGKPIFPNRAKTAQLGHIIFCNDYPVGIVIEDYKKALIKCNEERISQQKRLEENSEELKKEYFWHIHSVIIWE